MSYTRKILFAGTTSSGSSALFDYFRCFPNTCGLVSEMPLVFRKRLYPKWKSENFKNVDKYKHELNKQINLEAQKRYGNKLNGSVLLLNNVVTCLNLKGVELLDNIKIFCIVRDPRSTWLRRKELCKNTGIIIDVNQFIKEYQDQRDLFDKNFTNLTKNKDNIYIIRFEDFLLEENIKLKAIKWAGFDIKDYPDHPEYAPYPKEKSILRHKKYSRQEEIELIKNKLGKYCHEKV